MFSIGTDSKTEQLPKTKSEQKATSGVTGGFFDMFKASLSDETLVSSKLLSANKEWVYRNNDVIAKEVSTLELELFRVTANRGEVTLEKIEEHPALSSIDRFNGSTSKQDAIYSTQSHKKLTGDSFWLLERRGGEVKNIFLLDPTKITIEFGDFTKQSGRLINAYVFKDTIGGKLVERRYKPEDVIHFKTVG